MKKNNLITFIRWTARIIGSLFLIFVLFFLLAYVFGENESGEGFRNLREIITFIFFPIGTTIGLALALKWDGLGGLLTTGSMVGLYTLRPQLATNFYMIVPTLVGILFILHWLLTKREKEVSSDVR